MTKWTGEAWDGLKKRAEYIRRLFEKTGCLITADSSDDEKIQPQGLNDYKFQMILQRQDVCYVMFSFYSQVRNGT